MKTADRDVIARQHLDRLAEAVRKLGLKAENSPNDHRQPFPALTVTADAVSAVIMAGSAHFWRQAPEGDIRQVGPLDDPAKTARAVRKHLMEEQKNLAAKRRHAHERAKG